MGQLAHTFKTHRQLSIAAMVALVILLVIAIRYMGAEASQPNGDQAGGAMPVDVVVAEAKDVRLWNEFSGRLEAIHHVEIRPQVSGKITSIMFEEGAVVQKRDPLFVIDPRPYEASLAQAEAALAAARSQSDLAKLELDRAKVLVKKQAISESMYDGRYNAYQTALASVKAAAAMEQQARLNVEYAHIEAPVTGRVSRAEITEGNVVEAGPNAPLLTTIVSSDKLYAEFDVDEQTYINNVRSAKAGDAMPVRMTLAADKDTVYTGVIHSFDNQLDTNSGTIRARAIFENEDGALMPGMYADIQLGAAAERSAILIPERAIGTDQSKKFVYVINGDNKVTYTEITVGSVVEDNRVVLSGVEPGDRVMVNSLQRVRPDMAVSPVIVASSHQNQDAKKAVSLTQ